MFYCFQNPFTITQIEKAFNHKFSVIPGGILHSTKTSVLNQSLVRQILKLSRYSNGSSVLVTNCRTVSPSCTSKVSFSFKNFSTLAFASATPKTISAFYFRYHIQHSHNCHDSSRLQQICSFFPPQNFCIHYSNSQQILQ